MAAPLLAMMFGVAMALTSRGFFEADEISHFLYAQAAWHDWRNLVHIWGRLGATAVYALGAPLGLVGARLVAVGIMGLTGWGTVRLLDFFLRQPDTPWSAGGGFFRRHAAGLVWLFLFAQPCFPFYCFTVMTEMLLACCWVWALYALCRRKIFLASLLIGLGGLMRPEGWVAVAAWPLYLMFIRRVRAGPRVGIMALGLCSLFAALPVLGWYFLGVLAHHDLRWVIADWPWSAKSQYGQTALLFLASSLIAPALWMWVPIVFAAWRQRPRYGNWSLAWQILVVPPLGFFLLHATLGVLGLFGSMSLPRYFLAVAPFLAILTLLGLMLAEDGGGRWFLPRVALTLTVVPMIVLASLGYLPMRPLTEQLRLDVAINTVEARHVPVDQIITGHPYVCMRLGIDPDTPTLARVFHQAEIANAPAGTVLIADAMVWAYEGRPKAEELRAWGYREDPQVAAAVDAVSERFELLTLKPPGLGRVRLWIKQ